MVRQITEDEQKITLDFLEYQIAANELFSHKIIQIARNNSSFSLTIENLYRTILRDYFEISPKILGQFFKVKPEAIIQSVSIVKKNLAKQNKLLEEILTLDDKSVFNALKLTLATALQCLPTVSKVKK